MGQSIAQYGLIGDMNTSALVSADGSIDWLCWPDFDSESCFTNLIGAPRNGFWNLRPISKTKGTRRYLPGTNVIETVYKQILGGTVSVTDFMPRRNGDSSLVRVVRGLKDTVRMQTCLALRFDYGNVQPRLTKSDDAWSAVAGPHRVMVRSNVPVTLSDGDLQAEWAVNEGDTYFIILQHNNSFRDDSPSSFDALEAEQETIQFWTHWSSQSTFKGPYTDVVQRSLLTLRQLTYVKSGGFVAAPTTSIPEKIGGIRNWDYRYCWLRDTTFALLSLRHCGYHEEAKAWVQWLSRSIQGAPGQLKILYGITGKREHSEWKAEWLKGYEGSNPVNIGNAASSQLQLDVYGEVMDALYRSRCYGVYPLDDQSGNALEIPLLEHVEKIWSKPDAGLWEFRGHQRQFTQSKVMAWVAFDRGIRMCHRFGMDGPVDRWRKIRDQIHAQICKYGYHKGLKSFTQSYGSKHMDSSLLLLPLVGFLPIDDPRITGTVRAIEKRLMRDGLLLRYDTKRVDDGLPPGEGAFLACSFWLVDVYVLQGRLKEAHALFDRLVSLSNDLKLLSEEYDPKHGLVGNFPQALTHIALVDAALALATGRPVRTTELD